MSLPALLDSCFPMGTFLSRPRWLDGQVLYPMGLAKGQDASDLSKASP